MNRALTAGVLAAAALAASSAHAQGVAIDHKAVGCIVAGKFPKMNACFTPTSDVARARVYFRPEAATSWYYVDMKSDAPCFSGVLPKPSKALVNKKIDYYVEVQDKAFNAGRTNEYGPTVVASEGECRKDVPIAPISATGPAAVFPAVPIGFASTGAIGASTVVLGVAGVGAAAAGVAVAASSDEATTTTAGNVNTTTTVAATTTTVISTTTTTLATSNGPPNLVLRVTPDPPRGNSPLSVNFNACGSSDPNNDPLQFRFTFGDGTSEPYSANCTTNHTYTNPNPLRAAVNFDAEVCANDGLSERCRTRTVTPVSRCERDNASPTITIDAPSDGSTQPTTVNAAATADDDVGLRQVQFVLKTYGVYCGSPFVIVAQRNLQPPFQTTFDTSPFFRCGYQPFTLEAIARDFCGNETSTSVDFFVSSYARAASRGSVSRTTVVSDLRVEGARGQVVLNGASASMPGFGRSFAMGVANAGENRVEATLVEASGRAGTWRFELLSRNIAPGSLRVVAGDVVLVTENSVTFRLSGTPGERLVFTFQRK